MVGYGVQNTVPDLQADLVRYRGNPRLAESESALAGGWNLHVSSNRGERNQGGACFGDSGGPSFVEGSLEVVGVGSFVLNQHCVGAGYYYRVDTAHAQDWVQGFLP
ncbi:MAG: trypsin-like serine protease [Actinobacteria bacterium]|nr:trypsin-like serine protease [Actinomycetota bacterium]